MSVSPTVNPLNLVVCSYRVPDNAQFEDHEDKILGKEAHIYLIQTSEESNARTIIQRLVFREYKIIQRANRDYIAFAPNRFKNMKEEYNQGIVTVTALDTLTGIQVRSTCVSDTQQGCKLGDRQQWWDRSANDLALTVAPFRECGEYGKIYEKFFEPMDAGNLLVKLPIDHFDEKLSRIFKSAFRFHKIEKLDNDDFLPATFCVIHGKEQDSLVFSLVKPITKLFQSFSHPLITRAKNRLWSYIPSAEFFKRPIGKTVLTTAATLYLYHAHHLLTSLGLTLLNPLLSLPARLWMIYYVGIGFDEWSDYETFLAGATLITGVWSLNAPLVFCAIAGKLEEIAFLGALECTPYYYLSKRLSVKARVLGTAIGVALFEVATFNATGGYKSFIDFFYFPNSHMISLFKPVVILQ